MQAAELPTLLLALNYNTVCCMQQRKCKYVACMCITVSAAACQGSSQRQATLSICTQAAAKAVLAMQQKPPDSPAAAAASMQPPGQDREAALALSGEEAFARRAM